VDLQNASVSFWAGITRWKFGVVFLSCGGTCAISPFSSRSVVFDGIVNGICIIEGIFGMCEVARRMSRKESDIVKIWPGVSVSMRLQNLPGHWLAAGACKLPVAITFRMLQRTSRLCIPPSPTKIVNNTIVMTIVLPLLVPTHCIAALPTSLGDCLGDMGAGCIESPAIISSSIVKKCPTHNGFARICRSMRRVAAKLC
jgi:hypothetical protein